MTLPPSRNPTVLTTMATILQKKLQKVGDWDRGGQISEKLEELSRVPEFDPFLQRFQRKPPIWGSKVQAFQGQLSGRVPPPSSDLTPPIPVSEKVAPKICQNTRVHGIKSLKNMGSKQKICHTTKRPNLGKARDLET